MYEVIWQVVSKTYLLRPFSGVNYIKPVFIGTRDECAAWIVKHGESK